MSIRRTLTTAAAVLAMMLGGIALATPASAAPPSKVWQTNTRLNVRTEPNLNASIMTVLYAEARVLGTGQVRGDFTEIQVEGENFWVATRYLVDAGGATPTVPADRPPAPAPAPAPVPAPAPAPAPAPVPPPPAPAPAEPINARAPVTEARWQPKVGATFQMQYTGGLDLSLPVQIYNLDHEGATAADVARLRARGVDSICYINAGASEDWRLDRRSFPAAVQGRPLDGWPGERWLDIRRLDVLVPIMAARMDACKSKGFVAIDPDNTDGWQQNTGFPLTRAHQIAYQKALAAEAHKRGLAIGLKNNIEQLDDMAPFVDFAVNEQCAQYRECGAYTAFLASGKPVFNIEYSGHSQTTCARRPAGMSTIFKDLSLSARRSAC